MREVSIALASGAAGALISGIIAISLAVLGGRQTERALASERSARQAEHAAEQQEWYRRSVYEKRLEAIQEGYTWIAQFNTAITAATAGKPSNDAKVLLLDLCDRSRYWYDKNALWLHDGLPTESSFVGLINAAREYGLQASAEGDPVWESFAAADRAIRIRAERLFSYRLEHDD